MWAWLWHSVGMENPIISPVGAREQGTCCQHPDCHFPRLVHPNSNNRKARGLKRAGITRRSGDVSMCKQLIKIESPAHQETPITSEGK